MATNEANEANEAKAKAWTYTTRGPASSVLHLSTGLPIPTLPPRPPISNGASTSEEWILIRTSHAALNPAGAGLMGLVPFLAGARGTRTAVPEFDLSGTVQEVWLPGNPVAPPPPTPRFRKGDAVIAMLPFGYTLRSGQGALASHVALPASCAVAKPPDAACSFAEASGVPVCGTAAALLVSAAGVGEGHRVLVNGASGGVGTFAVQMARSAVGEAGKVVGVCSGRDEGLVKGLGADEIVDYTVHKRLPDSLAKQYGGDQQFDAILDCIGHPEVYNHSAGYLKPHGVYASVGSKLSPTLGGMVRTLPGLMCARLWPTSRLLGGAGRTYRGINVSAPNLKVMQEVADMIAAGKVRPVLDSEWAFEDALKAYEVLNAGHAKGKVVVRVDG